MNVTDGSSQPPSGRRCLVVAGVSGSGKSTLGALLASALGWRLVEGDDFHPPSNVKKMASGKPLTDQDREPWLDALGRWIDQHADQDGLVVTCSALRRQYRDRLRSGRPWLTFCLLKVPRETLAERLRDRTGHYMPASLLDSQLATLEPLAGDEPGFTLDATRPLKKLLQAAVARLPPAGPA